jgi:hypothetical protein
MLGQLRSQIILENIPHISYQFFISTFAQYSDGTLDEIYT